MTHTTGDIVTITNCISQHCFEIGEEVEIIEILKDGADELYRAESNGEKWYIMDDDII